MNTPWPSVQLDPELETARSTLSSINALVDEAVNHTEAWLQAKDKMHGHEWAVIELHARRLRTHSAALAQRIAELGSPFFSRLIAAADSTSIGDPPEAEKVIETEDAYDQDKLNSLGARDIRDAIEFNTEFKDAFGFAWIDEEIRAPLTDALEKLLDLLKDGNASIPGMMVTVLKVLLQGHPRGFGRYYSGTDPWPRPSAVVQVEIDARMPDALYWLRFELKEALEEEARIAQPTS
jgi:hypothetical protein